MRTTGRKKYGIFIATIILIGLCAPSFAQPTMEEMLTRMEQMEAHIKELQSRLSKYEQSDQEQRIQVSTIENKLAVMENKIESDVPASDIGTSISGIDISGGTTMVYQFTNRANGNGLSQNSEDVGDASYSIDLEFSKKTDSGLVFMHLETGDGAGVEDELQLFSNVNRDADDSDNQVQVTEIWYEHYAGSHTVTFGKIDATAYLDTNEYANDETSQFLGRAFRNSPAIEFPDNAPGLRFAFSPEDFWNIEALIMDGNGDWEDAGDAGFYASQLTLAPGLLERSGHYRIIGWLSDRDHTRWNDSVQTKKQSYGFGINMDQELTDHIGIFARYAWQNPKVYLNSEDFSLEHSYSIGTRINGEIWNRENDVIGIGFGQLFPSDDYKKSGSFNAKAESHVEIYYQYTVTENLHISPDLQIIWNPYGNDAVNGHKTILVGGLRTQVNF